jgi:peptidoglycan/LPS O-acetylase OafA/YrhL
MTTTGYRADIDGLRAIAVLLVVGFHAFPLNVPGGFIGVDVFFVISGYLITGLILQGLAAGKFSVLEFYTRRARRILPALCVVLAATLAVGWLIIFPTPYKRLGLDGLAGALFFPNLLYWSGTGYFDAVAASKPLLHLWSLGVEEQFYLLWPALLIALARWKMRATTVLCLISAASFLYSSVTVFHHPVEAFYSPVSRLWELGVGGVLASFRLKSRWPETMSLVGLAIVLISAIALTDQSPFPGLLAALPVVGASLAIIGRSAVLAWPPLVAVGLMSYPLYLWHWPLLSLSITLDFHTTLAKAIVIVLTAILAYATTRYIEYPVRFGSFRSSGVVASIVSMAYIAAAAVAVYWNDGFLQRYPPAIRPVLATKEYVVANPAYIDPCWLIDDRSFGSRATSCEEGDVLIWGDSYAGALATGFAKPHAQFVRSGCLPLLKGTTDPCARGNAEAVAAIVRLKPKRIVLFGRWLLRIENWKREPELQEGLRATLSVLRQGADDVVLVGRSPYWWPSLPDLVYRYWSKAHELPDRLDAVSKAAPETDAVLRELADANGARFVSILDALCSAQGCLTHTAASRDELLAFDYGHFTAAGARYLVQTLSLDLPDRPRAQTGGAIRFGKRQPAPSAPAALVE